jgi:hypothetical protein
MEVNQLREEPLGEGVLPLPPREEGDDWEPDAEFLADSVASQLSIARSTRRARILRPLTGTDTSPA